jgi:hypothetical protein
MQEGEVVLGAGQAPFVALETSVGTMVVELYWKYAPKTCAVGAPAPRAARLARTTAQTPKAPRLASSVGA